MIFMGDGGISVDLGGCLPYLEQRFREMIGKDPASLEAAAWLSSLQKTAMVLASHVYCVGMHQPLPFKEHLPADAIADCGIRGEFKEWIVLPRGRRDSVDACGDKASRAVGEH